MKYLEYRAYSESLTVSTNCNNCYSSSSQLRWIIVCYSINLKHAIYRWEFKYSKSAVHPTIFRTFDHLSLNANILPNLASLHIYFPRCSGFYIGQSTYRSLRSLDFDFEFKAEHSWIDSLLCHHRGQNWYIVLNFSKSASESKVTLESSTFHFHQSPDALTSTGPFPFIHNT